MARANNKREVSGSSRPSASSKPHTRVIFEFYNMETAREFTGSVSHDSKTMTIEIPAQPGTQHCLVRGVREGHLFHGRNSFRELDPVDVEATWCDMGDGYLCLWIEEGIEYVVRFTLPR